MAVRPSRKNWLVPAALRSRAVVPAPSPATALMLPARRARRVPAAKMPGIARYHAVAAAPERPSWTIERYA